MRLGGLMKMTLLDFPGRVACTVFTVGCNMRCPFCHNASLVVHPEELLDDEDFFDFLKRRKGMLDGVCVTGGEPLLHLDLPFFLSRIRDLGFATKLDTNGTYPDALRKVVEAGLVDYVAMDIKSPLEKYGTVSG
ncbi:MAG: anaerobic ribonucleoside-triphosphate reductase activating protein, partial [Clostridia bacterium]|nr:anaerobic ribonucleoside-triphosphate reductase activating protein [Clostridia bacterium]